jgi:hypothetical protein
MGPGSQPTQLVDVGELDRGLRVAVPRSVESATIFLSTSRSRTAPASRTVSRSWADQISQASASNASPPAAPGGASGCLSSRRGLATSSAITKPSFASVAASVRAAASEMATAAVTSTRGLSSHARLSRLPAVHEPGAPLRAATRGPARFGRPHPDGVEKNGCAARPSDRLRSPTAPERCGSHCNMAKPRPDAGHEQDQAALTPSPLTIPRLLGGAPVEQRNLATAKWLFRILFGWLVLQLIGLTIWAWLTYPTDAAVIRIAGAPSEATAVQAIALRAQWQQSVLGIGAALAITPMMALLSAVVGYLLRDAQSPIVAPTDQLLGAE